MGVFRLPSIRDYFSIDDIMPIHPLLKKIGLSRDRFLFLWRHFHIRFNSGKEEYDNEDAVEFEEDDNVFMQRMERVVRDQEDKAVTGELSDEEDEDEDEVEAVDLDEEDEKEVWFHKLQDFMTHFKEVSTSMVHVLGHDLSLDKMIILFMGKSLETYRLKNKPIKEGYKFFVLASSFGYILNFTPDGRTAAKNQTQEYEEDTAQGKIESMIMFVTDIIDDFRRQNRSVWEDMQEKGVVDDDNKDWVKFCLAMDNYFTLPKIMKSLRNREIGVVGTSRFRKAWPPNKLKQVNMDSANFNDFTYLVDEEGTLVARWMDNGLFLMVSTMHKPGTVTKVFRRRPRKTVKNRRHVEEVWGNESRCWIYIPQVVDDYNKGMGGVDITDQRIAYYAPDIRCRRNWLPMFLQMLSMIRNNSYVVHESILKDKASSHKTFILDMIRALLRCGRNHPNRSTRQSSTSLPPPKKCS